MTKQLKSIVLGGLVATAVMTVLMLVAPMMGMGLFSSHAPQALLLVMGSLVGHLVYGAVLGLVTGRSARKEGTVSAA